jgi:hypothetical protein
VLFKPDIFYCVRLVLDPNAKQGGSGEPPCGELGEGLELTQRVLGGLDALLELLEFIGVFLVTLGLGREPDGELFLGILDALDRGLEGFGFVRVGLDEGLNVGGAEADYGFELRNERFGGLFLAGTELANLGLTVAGEDDVARESADCEFGLQLVVPSDVPFRDDGLVLREIEGHEQGIFGGVFFPRILGENALVHEFTPAAPVGSGEVNQKRELLLGRNSLGSVEVHGPVPDFGTVDLHRIFSGWTFFGLGGERNGTGEKQAERCVQ